MAKEDLPFDYNKICRLCMTEEPKMMTIFTEEPGIVPLPLRIMACVSIEVNLNFKFSDSWFVKR